MMSNANLGITDPGAASGQGHTSQRSVQFRTSASQQQLMRHSHHHQQQQQHEASGLANITPKSQSSDLSYLQRSASALPLSQHGHKSQHSQHSQHSQQYLHSSQPHSHYNSSSQPSMQQHHQQRPPMPPTTHQPRLHHSMSTGNISMAASANRYPSSQGAAVGVGGINSSNTLPLKKKDPYATAWRTYSKIAEELQLSNPDGSLYPISKEAILKYLHHQSRRIKSSNLHWYVNGLKKHQENLGFPWDDVRYDEEVVSLLKELTLHPVMINENGDDDGQGHTYGSQPNRQRQSNTGMYPSGRSGHHYSTSSIDTTRIANLSISQPQPQPQQQQQHPTQQKPQSTNSSSYGNTGLKQQQQQQQQQYMQQQQLQMQSQRIQQPPPPKPYYHSTPINTPSHHTRSPSTQESPYQSIGNHHHSPSSSISLSTDTHTIQQNQIGNSASTLTKRKRDDFGLKKRRVPTSLSMEGEDNEDNELLDDDLKDDEFGIADRRTRDVDDYDDLEDSNRYQPLKRRASTGTLLSQARVSGQVKHVPSMLSIEPITKTYQKDHDHADSLVNNDGTNIIHRQRSDQHLRINSDPREEGSTDSYLFDRNEGIPKTRDSPPDSASSNSSLNYLTERETQQRYRHVSSNGIVTSPLSSTAPSSSAPPAPIGSLSGRTGKTTVHFSEVVECAQQLQAKYGHKCKDHPWGCVEISEDRHLELTMKMYLDWAGLVASGRLTMEELPDLPEFRNIHPVVGGTLRRMASTPLTSTTNLAVSRLASSNNETSISRRFTTSKDSSLSSGSDRNYFGPYRSPSSSPPSHPPHHDKDLATEDASLPSRIGSPPLLASTQGSPPPANHVAKDDTSHVLHARARKMPSTPSLSQYSRHRLEESDIVPQRGHPHIPSTISNSTASSPPSEELTDDEAEEDEEEIDTSNYALSPWAFAPSAIEARVRITEKLNVGQGQQSQRGPTSLLPGSNQTLTQEDKIEESTVSADIDGERAVSVLGEILEASEKGIERVRADDGPSSSVDAAAKVLDSMIIGRSPDSYITAMTNVGSNSISSGQTEVVDIQFDSVNEETDQVQGQEEDSVMMET